MSLIGPDDPRYDEWYGDAIDRYTTRGDDMEHEDDTNLVLPDGTVYEARFQRDDDGERRVDTATCGTCGFTWNDALISGITPVPSGRCPNEYEH